MEPLQAVALGPLQAVAPRPGRFKLYAMAADGSAGRLLTYGVSGAFPVWSPDGNAIMFSGSRGGDGDTCG